MPPFGTEREVNYFTFIENIRKSLGTALLLHVLFCLYLKKPTQKCAACHAKGETNIGRKRCNVLLGGRRGVHVVEATLQRAELPALDCKNLPRSTTLRCGHLTYSLVL